MPATIVVSADSTPVGAMVRETAENFTGTLKPASADNHGPRVKVDAAPAAPIEEPENPQALPVNVLNAANSQAVDAQASPAAEQPSAAPAFRSEPQFRAVPSAPMEMRRPIQERQEPPRNSAENGPAVHIGLLEVVVISPDGGRSETRRESVSPAGMSSRHYLRNL